MKRERVLVTGGAGFIGSNLANRLIAQGHCVTILDNLSRPGGRWNLAWLRETHGPDSFRLIECDIANFESVRRAVCGVGRIYHLAGQVAVTTSVANPSADFAANALGTFNVVEAARQCGDDPIIIYASTNKVYGDLEHVAVLEDNTRYRYLDQPMGIAETQPIDFHSPYGCSKGAGDQYARDYARIYGLRTIVARQSCIYGWRQFGVEDQGWLVWFMIAALQGRPISIYGNGKQVRDVLFIDDLLDAYDAMVLHIDRSAGKIFNIGGGPDNTLSIWAEFGATLEKLVGRTIAVRWLDGRPGDQRIYISDIRRAETELRWKPKVAVADGIAAVYKWIKQHESLFGHVGGEDKLLAAAQ